MEVIRHPVILDDTAVLSLVCRHNTIGVVEGTLRERFRFVPSHILGALGAEHTRRDTKPDAAINTALPTVVVLAVLMECVDVITEKRSTVIISVRHQRFVRVEFQMAFLVEKGGEGMLNVNGFTFRPDQPQQKSSSAGELHPRALLEPYVSLSAHTAPINQPSASPAGAASERTVSADAGRFAPANAPPTGDAP